MIRILLSMLFAVIIVYVIYFITIKATYDEDHEIEQITKVIDSSIGWFKEKDFDLLYSTVVKDSKYLSVHPSNKIVKGYDEFIKNCEIFKNPNFIYVKHEIKDLQISISKSKTVAWFYCILDDINTWQGQPANWENVRRTGVLEKQNGEWVIVQQHFSYAKD